MLGRGRERTSDHDPVDTDGEERVTAIGVLADAEHQRVEAGPDGARAGGVAEGECGRTVAIESRRTVRERGAVVRHFLDVEVSVLAGTTPRVIEEGHGQAMQTCAPVPLDRKGAGRNSVLRGCELG